MSKSPAQQEAENKLVFEEALSGAPEFFDIPEEMQKQIEEQVEARERFFWLSATHIKQDIVTRALLRRAIYAEVRVVETECRLGEMGLICRAAKERIGQLEAQVKSLAEATDKEVDLTVFDLEGKD